MDQRKSERNSAREFWKLYQESGSYNPSIKQVFKQYKTWAQEQNLPILNEYIFRTYIRRHGYCNFNNMN